MISLEFVVIPSLLKYLPDTFIKRMSVGEKISLNLFFCLFLIQFNTIAHCEKYIFKIKATFPPKIQTEQIGFKISGFNGIITTLHGIANSKSIRVISCENQFSGAYVLAGVDFANDAALLVPAEESQVFMRLNEGFIV